LLCHAMQASQTRSMFISHEAGLVLRLQGCHMTHSRLIARCYLNCFISIDVCR
jgi:hypothetical protein